MSLSVVLVKNCFKSF